MSYVAIADQHAHLHDPQTFITKYIWSQDHKVIAIQYMVTAMAIGLVSVFAGLTIAYYADLPPGGAIVLVAAGAFVVAALLDAARRRV